MAVKLTVDGEEVALDERLEGILRALVAPQVVRRLDKVPTGEVAIRFRHRTVKGVMVTETFGAGHG